MSSKNSSITTRFKSPVGWLELAEKDGKILYVTRVDAPTRAIEPQTPALRQAKLQLEEYFDGRRKRFDLPLAPPNSEFDRKVWSALKKIPFGHSVAYSELAEQIGNPKGARAVGSACGRNPHMIVVPCHRILAKHKRIGGFSGGPGVKETLLQLEDIEHL